MEDQFRKTEEQYFILRGKMEAGRIAREEFEHALKELMVQDARGRYWVLGTDTGKWHVHENGKWIEGDPSSGRALNAPARPALPTTLPEQRGAPWAPPPPRETRSTPAPAPQQRGGRSGCLVKGCLVAIIVLIVLGVVGYFGVQSGALSQNRLLNLIGQGPADIEVDNFRDDAIQVNIVRADPVGAGTPTPTTLGLQLNAFDVRTHRAQNPGRYRVEFRTVRGSAADLGSCTLAVRGGDHWQFVVLPERIAVYRVNNPSSVGRDFVIQSSALCR